MQLRSATHADAGAIAAIYNEGIADREATFETRPRTPDEVAAWLGEPGPFLVGEDGGTLLGFARVSAYSDRCVYAGVGEHGVYVARAARGARRRAGAARGPVRGGGARRLLQAHRRGSSPRTRRAAPSTARPASTRSAIQRRHGKLDGEWRDCVLVERLLGEAAARRTLRVWSRSIGCAAWRG